VASDRTAADLTAQGLEQLELAETAKWRASNRKHWLRFDVETELKHRASSRKKLEQLSDRVIDVTTDTRASKDPAWKGQVGLNNWHMDQAQTYFLAALAVGREEDRRPVGWRVDDEPAT
jgi:hypothetical protein